MMSFIPIHKEAFCLMKYACKTCHHSETIWNSRDGVTPFGCQCPSCGESMFHAEFYNDKQDEWYKLNKLQKYWRDGTVEEAIEIIRKRLENADGTDWEKTKEEKEKMILDVGNHACKPHTDYPDGNHSWSEFQKGWPMLDIYTGE